MVVKILCKVIWGFPTIRGTILGVPIIGTIVYWGLYWGPPVLGNYHIYPDSPFWGTRNVGIIGTILGFYGDSGKEHGNYYIGVIYTLVVPFWVP